MAGTRFNEILRNRRVTAGFRAARDFSEALGINENRYSRYERGTSEPSLSMLITISQLLNTTPNDLLGFSASQTTVSSGAPGFENVDAPTPYVPHEAARDAEEPALVAGATLRLNSRDRLDILTWQLADAYATEIEARARAPGKKSGRGDAERLPRVAKIFARLKDEGLAALSRLLTSAEFAAAPAGARKVVQSAADELLALLLAPLTTTKSK